MLTVGLPKDKPQISSFLLSFCIYTMYIYTFCYDFPSKIENVFYVYRFGRLLPVGSWTFLGVLANFNLWGEREHPRNYP